MKIFNKQNVFLTLLITLFAIQTSFGQEEKQDGVRLGLGASLFSYIEVIDTLSSAIDQNEKKQIESVVNLYDYYRVGAVDKKKVVATVSKLYELRGDLAGAERLLIDGTFDSEYFFNEHFNIGTRVQHRTYINEGDWFRFIITSVVLRFYF